MKKQILFILLLTFSTSIFAQIRTIKVPRGATAPSTIQFKKNKDLSYFLKIEGIDGTSNDAKHRNWIAINGFDFDITPNRTDSGRVTGGVKTHFVIYKNSDLSSVEIASSTHTNRFFPKMTIEVTQLIGGKRVVILQYQLEDVSFTSYNLQTDKHTNLLFEDIKLLFGSITMIHYSYDQVGNPVSKREREINLHSMI